MGVNRHNGSDRRVPRLRLGLTRRLDRDRCGVLDLDRLGRLSHKSAMVDLATSAAVLRRLDGRRGDGRRRSGRRRASAA